MSVLKAHRSESKAEFVNVANKIYIQTIAFLSRLSSRYSRLVSKSVSELASEVVDHAEKANSIYPSDAARKELRKQHLLEARASLMALDVHLAHCYGQAYYDKFAGKIQINTPEQEGGCKLKIVDNLTTVNFRSGNMTPKYIVIHYFGALGTAKSVSEYFKTPGIQASAHYALDEGDTIYRCVRDKDIAWHCGANKYKHPECRNSNSIGIEARPSKINRKRVMASDTDWYFEPKVVDNLVWLTKKLMAQYNIPADHVIRHYDVTGKLCPRPWCCADMNVYYKTSGDAQWEEFKKRISDGKEEDEDMTLDTFKELMKEYRAELQDNDCGTWSKEAREWAISNGLINGTGTEVNGEPNYAWADQLTREQAAALFYRFAKLMGKA